MARLESRNNEVSTCASRKARTRSRSSVATKRVMGSRAQPWHGTCGLLHQWRERVAQESEQTLSSALRQKARALELEMRERQRMEDALHEAERRRDEFLATLAHELRNPLAPIRNATEIIRLADDNPARVAAARALIERQLAHLVRLIDDLLDVSRITRGRLALHTQRTDLTAVLDEALE